MNTKSRHLPARPHTAALLALLGSLASATPASAQLGQLIVNITSPSSGATVSGTVNVNASVTIIGGLTVRGVQFKLDGVNLGAEDTSAPYSVPWNTTTVSNGSHTLTAVARDLLGLRFTSNPVTVTVANTLPDTTPPTVAVTSPGNGATVSGTTTIAANASDNVGVAGVQFFVDGAAHGAEDTTAPYSVSWNTTTASNGSHTLTARARDAAGNATTSAPVTVTVSNAVPDTTPPSVNITAPANGATVSGTTTVAANASDNVGVAGVQFFVDGAAHGAEDTTAPYSVAWDTTTASDGSHMVTAVARDAGGNTASSSVSVTVSNAPPPPPASGATRFENMDLSIVYTDGCVSCGQSPTWFHGSRSRSWSGVTASFNRSSGARATFTFTGTTVRWIGFRAPWAGIGRVYLDGVMTEIDLYSTTEQVQATIFEATNLAAGSHTLVVESTGTKNAQATDYAVVLDAIDIAPAVPPTTVGTRTEETAPSITFTAGWTGGDTTRAWSGGTAASSGTAGARTTFTFTGTTVSWVGLREPGGGIARVFLDGAFQAQVDTYSPIGVQAVVFTLTDLAPASHRLEIEVTGQRNPAATGSQIVVDAFDVQTRIEDADSSVVYTGAWSLHNTDRNFSGTSQNTGGGTAARSQTAGTRADFSFTGTSVSLVGFRGPWAGLADVFLDGAFATRVDLFSPGEQVQTPVFAAGGLAAGPHTLRIDVTGDKNPAATAALVHVDAFDITVPQPAPPVTRKQETDSSITYAGSWTASGTTPLWSGQTAVQATTSGAQATVTFTGTAIRWLGERGFATGVVRVSVDGVFVAQVDTRTALQEEYQAVLFGRTGLAPGSHTLTIDVIGRNGEPPGVPVERVVVDAFDVY